MSIHKDEIRLVLIFIILISLASQVSALNYEKNRKISSHYLKPELPTAEKNVEAIVYLTDPDKVKRLEDYATIEIISGNLVQVRTTPGKLKEIAELPFVGYIRKPKHPHENAINEAVARMEAQNLQNLSIRGSGIKIAILDEGFQNYHSFLGTALPANVITRSFRADGDINAGEVHGTAVAELAYSVAPGAQMYLVNYETDLEFQQAVNWLIQQQVDIISHSAGYTTGPFDGTGFIDDIVNNAINNGIVWVNAAGNYAKQHWQGRFADVNGNGWNAFSDGDETNKIIAQQGDIIDIGLSWDDWINVDQDYDLYLFDNNGNLVAVSYDPQNGQPGQEPVEEIQYVANYTGVYEIMIRKYDATRDVFFELYSTGPHHELQYDVPSSSLAIPADVERVISVGATKWQDDSLEPFSSEGPTRDGRIKPDLTAPDGVSTATYGTLSFFGTSASAPNAAGSVALLLSAANLSVNGVKAALENAALDRGPIGKDNLYGAGRIDVYNAYKQIVPPHIEILSPGHQIFNRNDTILIYGSSNRVLEPLNITVNGPNYTLTLRKTTQDNGSWGIGLNTSSLFAGNYFINASIPSANASSSFILVNRSLVLNFTPSNLISGVSMSIIANVRDLTGSPVSGALVTLSGDNFTLSNITDQSGNSSFIVTASGQVNATATKTGHTNGTANLTAVTETLTTITVSPATATVLVGNNQTFTATPGDQFGITMNITVIWSSSNTTVGTINNITGVFTALAAGTTTVNATNQSITGNATATVVTVALPLNITASRTNITVGLATNVTFTVTSAGVPVNGATVTIGTVAQVSGTTNAAGTVTLEVTAVTNGTKTVTANMAGFTSGTTSLMAKGDVNGDGAVTIVDALFIAQNAVGSRTFNSAQVAAADVNGDGQVTIVDALFIAQYTVGRRADPTTP